MAFLRVDQCVPAITGFPVWLICPIRNEIALLPDFLRHYRSLGIDTFCFIDNGSVDGTRDYLLAQPDCLVYYTDESYKASGFAADWVNRVIAELRISGWFVLVDADEHLCYAHMERRDIRTLLASCQQQGSDALYGVMVDMYPAGSFMDVHAQSGDRLSHLMPYFDSQYIFRRWPQRPGKRHRNLQILGGPRCRLLSSLETEHRRGWKFSLAVNQVDRFIEYVPQSALPWLARAWPREIPSQVKTPVNFVRPGFRLHNSHASTNLNFANELTSLLHYKFCGELKARFTMAAVEGNHYRRGLSYLQLQQSLNQLPGQSLIYAGSRRFRSSGDLLDIGLVGPRAAVAWTSGFTQEFRTGADHRRGHQAPVATASNEASHNRSVESEAALSAAEVVSDISLAGPLAHSSVLPGTPG